MSNHPAQNAIPGVFALFEETQRVISPERMRLAGYAAWLIMPALATFGLSFLPLSPLWNTLLRNIILVGDILLGIWVSASLTLVALRKFQRQSFDDQAIVEHVLKTFPVLVYLFAFSFLCIIGGIYLLFLPGMIAFVWLAFGSILALDIPGLSFSTAVTRSRNLSKGRFWQVFWRLIGGNILFGLAYLALSTLILSLVFALAGIDPRVFLDTTLLPRSVIPPWISLLLIAFSLPFVPYRAVYHVALYEALKKA
ncbi:hypothetical protein EBT31_06420 [bacterium]|nr:hypothetical protein [bacterium]